MRKFSPDKDEGSNCSTGATFNKKVKLSESGKDEEEGGRKGVHDHDTHLKSQNSSVQMSIYKDPETLEEVLIMVLHLHIANLANHCLFRSVATNK